MLNSFQYLGFVDQVQILKRVQDDGGGVRVTGYTVRMTGYTIRIKVYTATIMVGFFVLAELVLSGISFNNVKSDKIGLYLFFFKKLSILLKN
jgi:hypothetical protein